ncbi:MAG: urocanate hydratase [Planctomycetota bacterium]
MTRPYTPVSAPRGTDLACKSWPAEAALRMLMNCHDPEIAVDPEQAIVHGAAGRAIRSWEDFDATANALKELEPDETLVVQSGRPVAVFRTHLLAPRVVMASAMLVPAWSSADEFRGLRQRQLTISGDMTAGAWLFVGPQSGACTAWEALRAVAADKFGNTLKQRLMVSSGLGGLGAGQAPAANSLGATLLVAEVNAERVSKLAQKGLVHHSFGEVGAAIDKACDLKGAGTAETVAFTGHAIDLLAALVERKITPDIVTDLTPAHDMQFGYIPRGMSFADAKARRAEDATALEKQATESAAMHVKLILELQAAGAVAFEFGNNLRAQAELGGLQNAFDLPGVTTAWLRQRFVGGRRPMLFVALSGDDDDIQNIDNILSETAGVNDPELAAWIASGATVRLQRGLPARVAWLRAADHLRVAEAINKQVRDQGLNAPVLIARDQFDPGHAASPFRETETMPDGSDAVADWPILGALLNSASGATWVSISHGGGTGIGYSVHSAMAIVANGSPEADQRLARVMAADPGMGLVRFAEAGDPTALATARDLGVKLPHQG